MPTPTPNSHLLQRFITLLLTCTASVLAPAATIWNGPLFTYTQPSPDPTDPANQDQLTPNVSLTRYATAGIFNAVTESSFTKGVSPADTEWAVGSLDDYAALSYTDWTSVGGGRPVLSLVGQQLVLHLITDDIYLSVQFTYLGGEGAGGFAYNRSTPAAAPPPPPSVTLTNPADGTILAAPANIQLSADASVSAGSVTNVQFFAGGISLGAVNSMPFTLAATNLSAGSYQFTAAATAGGISTTSGAVNVTVVVPVAVNISVTNVQVGQFSFSYSANSGLQYVVQDSTDLLNWASLSTNMASASSVSFTNPSNPSNPLFFRIERLPNP